MLRITLFILALFITCSSQAQVNVSFSHNTGIYDSTFILIISSDSNNFRYTLNGSHPANGSNLKDGTIEINKTTIVRLQPYKNGKRLDSVITKTYVIDFETELPIVSIAIEDSALWSNNYGIYVKGNNGYYSDSTGHYENTNYSKKWERKMHFTFIDSNGKEIVNQDAGIRLHGETTRRLPEKSLKIVARSEYGKKRFSGVSFPLKPHITEHKQFVLRTSGNDYRKLRFKDCLSAYLARDLDLEYMAYQPVQVFVNGDYWGLYNLREKINKHYLCYNKNADEDSSSIIMGRWVRQHGSASDYMKMYRYFEHLDTMTDKAYQKVSEMLDIRNYINYRVTQIYLNNSDSRGNIRYWKSNDVSDKFRMILYDTDHSYGSYNRKYLEKCLSSNPTDWFNPKWSTMYLSKLIEHPDFKRDFVNQFAHLLNTNFHEDNVNLALDKFVSIYKDELPRDKNVIFKKFRNGVHTEEKWLDDVMDIRKYSRLRPKHLYSEIDRLLADNKGTYVLSVKGSSGAVSINGNVPVKLPYEGLYFKGFDLSVQIIEVENMVFKHWGNGSQDSIYIIKEFNDTISLAPKFEKIEPVLMEDVLVDTHKSKEEKSAFQWMLLIAFGLIGVGVILVLIYLFKR